MFSSCTTLKLEIPKGLPSLLHRLSKAVIQEQPEKLYEFAANFLESELRLRAASQVAEKVGTNDDVGSQEVDGKPREESSGKYASRQSERDAAIKIQAGYREYKTRKEMNLVQRLSNDKNPVKAKSPPLDTIKEEEEAATKIQAGIRGFLTRKRMKQSLDMGQSQQSVDITDDTQTLQEGTRPLKKIVSLSSASRESDGMVSALAKSIVEDTFVSAEVALNHQSNAKPMHSVPLDEDDSVFGEEQPQGESIPKGVELSKEPISIIPEENELEATVTLNRLEDQVQGGVDPEITAKETTDATAEHEATSVASEKEFLLATTEASEKDSPLATTEASEKESPLATTEASEKESLLATTEASEKESPLATTEELEKEFPLATTEASEKESPLATTETSEQESPLPTTVASENEPPSAIPLLAAVGTAMQGDLELVTHEDANFQSPFPGNEFTPAPSVQMEKLESMELPRIESTWTQETFPETQAPIEQKPELSQPIPETHLAGDEPNVPIDAMKLPKSDAEIEAEMEEIDVVPSDSEKFDSMAEDELYPITSLATATEGKDAGSVAASPEPQTAVEMTKPPEVKEEAPEVVDTNEAQTIAPVPEPEGIGKTEKAEEPVIQIPGPETVPVDTTLEEAPVKRRSSKRRSGTEKYRSGVVVDSHFVLDPSLMTHEIGQLDELNAEIESDAATMSDAATRIQAGYRGYQVRKNLNSAATKIQSSYRGYKTRKNLKHEADAAVKIQANVRGYLTRKIYKKKVQQLGQRKIDAARRRSSSGLQVGSLASSKRYSSE